MSLISTYSGLPNHVKTASSSSLLLRSGAEAGQGNSSHLLRSASQTLSLQTLSLQTTEVRISDAGLAQSEAAGQAEALGQVAQAGQATQTPNRADFNPYSTRILQAIEGQLARDIVEGASPDDLAARLQAGLEGFLSGFNSALASLKDLPGFGAEIEADLLETQSQVLSGLKETAGQLGLDAGAIQSALDRLAETQLRRQASSSSAAADSAPTYSSPTANQTAGSQSLFGARHERFELSLMTQEGDKITLLIDNLQALSLEQTADSSELSWQSRNQAAWRIEGDLNADEIHAINQLLSPIGRMREAFFEGDVQGAWDQALQLGGDPKQILQYSLSLSQQTHAKVEQYQQRDSGNAFDAESPAGLSRNLKPLGAFLRALDAAEQAVNQLRQYFELADEPNDRIAARFADALNPQSSASILAFLEQALPVGLAPSKS